MTTNITPEERTFLVGLEKLTRETGIAIDGCGCCGSPYLTHVSGDERTNAKCGYGFVDSNKQLAWITPKDEYDWEHYSDSIVRSKDAP